MLVIGILNLHKPTGMTSRRAVDRVGRVVGRTKIGHAGTLDPIAEGVLLVCLGQATRLVPYLHDLPKRYRATFRLGVTSQTDDVEGELIPVPDAPRPHQSEVLGVLQQLTGEIQQTPPAYSAVKIAGRRAYELARCGKQFKLSAKTVRIDRLEMIRYDYPELVVDVVCGSGTYIRSLGRDVGKALATGAVMSQLLRSEIGPFRVDDAHPLEALTPATVTAALSPPLLALAHLPRVTLTASQVQAVRFGQQIMLADPPAAEQPIAAVDADGNLVAIMGIGTDGCFRPNRVFG